MGILKNLTDEYFDKIVRKEDYVKFNIDEMKPLDMGGSILWADRDLEIVDGGGFYEYKKHFLAFDYLKMKFSDGWRLPTFKEYLDLFNKDIRKVESLGCITFEFKDNLLYFDVVGYYQDDANNKRFYSKDSYGRWTSDVYTGEDPTFTGDPILFDVSVSNRLILRYKKGLSTSVVFFKRYCPIRLVKNKK